MALKSTVIKADVQIADMNRNYYANHLLTIAQHPSETDERVMMRLLAFVLHASESLMFTKGLSTEDEPDLWEKDYTEHIKLWIELGQIDGKRIKKGCNKSDQVHVYTYQPYSFKPWWDKIKSEVTRYENLYVYTIENQSGSPIENMMQRTMKLQCTIQDDSVYLMSDQDSIELKITKIFGQY